MSERRYLITSALPYVDGVKHLGNLAGSMLPADVYARFLRARGNRVLFVCATDEHGTPAELAADRAGLDLNEYCRRQHETQARLCEEFGLSFDVFGRSSATQNKEQTRYFAQRLDEEGFLEARSMRQVFSPTDGRFLPDRYILGTCPHCGYDRACGDQCEDCGRLQDPTELVDARSAISGSRDLEVRDSRHLFLLQSKLVGKLREWLKEKSDWPPLARSIGLSGLDEGVRDRSVTRDLTWGVPVERLGFEEKVYYVWFDALIAYIGATREWAEACGEPDAWREWWRASDDVRYVQFMAKDNVPFHTVGFPCMLIGSGEEWKLVDYLKAFNWLTYYGGKFSTGERVGVFMDQALHLLSADYWRYYLMVNAPEADDTCFSWETFAAVVNEDLVENFGNFVNRSLGLADRHFGGEIPSGGDLGAAELELLEDLNCRLGAYTDRMDALEFRDAIDELRAIWSLGNAYFVRKQPWTLIREDRDEAALTLRFCVNLVSLFARLSAPTMPFTASRVLDALVVPPAERGWPSAFAGDELPSGHRFTVPPLLFHGVAETDVERWRARFGAAPA